MKHNTEKNELQKETIIQHALRTGGFTFPQTVSEVDVFEKIFGTTEVALPDDLKHPSFLENLNTNPRSSMKNIELHVDNFAIAARGGAPELPDEILKQMEEDRRKSDEKKK